MENAIVKFKDFLKTHNSLWSKEREIIVKYIFSLQKHFTGDELFLDLKQKGYSISRATVYRTLDLLVRSSLVSKLQLQSGTYLYERNSDDHHHDHLICAKCGKIIEFHSDAIEAIQQQIADQNNFKITGHNHRICGICKECQETEK